MDLIILAILVLPLVYFIVLTFGQKSMPDNTVVAFTGGLGSGKTFMAVRSGIKHHRNHLINYYVERLPFNLFTLLFGKKYKERPSFYSNIPVRITLIPFISFWSRQLSYEHLILKDRIEEYSTILIDEIGQFASQYEYDHPFVQQYVQEFIRFYRHYIDGKLIITDQSSSNIVVSIRRRINQIYNLSNFRKTFLFFYMIDVSEIHITEDMLTIKEANLTEKETPYFFGFILPNIIRLIFGIKKSYDSRCYSLNYKSIYNPQITTWNAFKTSYFIELPNTLEYKKIYKINGRLTEEETLTAIKEWKNKK
jgi:hypothetical protein